MSENDQKTEETKKENILADFIPVEESNRNGDLIQIMIQKACKCLFKHLQAYLSIYTQMLKKFFMFCQREVSFHLGLVVCVAKIFFAIPLVSFPQKFY